jgi:nucleoside-diphosphate-sugar epimerase
VPYPEYRKKIDIGDYYSSFTRFANATGWRPHRTLSQSLERTLAYYDRFMPTYL